MQNPKPEPVVRQSFNEEERCHYPALLTSQDKSHDPSIFEYTHVWDVRTQQLDKRKDTSVLTSIANIVDASKCPQHHRPSCPHSTRIPNQCIYEKTRASLLETEPVTPKPKPVEVPVAPPTYFDLDTDSTSKYTASTEHPLDEQNFVTT